MTPLALLSNIALLVSLTVIQQLLLRRWDRHSTTYKFLSGVTFGVVGVAEMMTPFHVSEGLFYDSRSILLSTAGMFGGPIIGGIAAGICTLYRVAVGGVGVYVGVGTIIEAVGLGVVMYYARRRYPVLESVLSLWVFGVVVHLVMLLLMLGLPTAEAQYVFAILAWPVLGLYPLGNVIIGWLLLDQEERHATDTRLTESEGRYRSMFLHSHAVMLIVDVENQRFLDANPAAALYYGYSREALIGMPVSNINILSGGTGRTDGGGEPSAGTLLLLQTSPRIGRGMRC